MPLLCPRSKGVSSEEAMKIGVSIGLSGVHEYNGGYHPGNSHEEFNKGYYNYIKNKKNEQQPKENTEPEPEPKPEPDATEVVEVVKKKLVRSKSTPTEKKEKKERKPRVSKSKPVKE